MATTKKRNPNDATFRNITALKKRVAVLELRADALKRYDLRLLKHIWALEKILGK